MKRTQELFERIEDYIEGRLEGEELLRFEKSLEDDPALKEEVNLHLFIKEAFYDAETRRFRKKLQDIHQEVVKEDYKTTKVEVLWGSNIWKRFYKAAAIFVVSAGFLYVFWFGFIRNDDLFIAYYTGYPTDSIHRGHGTQDDLEYRDILINYKEENYLYVIRALEDSIRFPKISDRIKLYLGNSYLRAGQEKEAVNTFKLITKKSTYYADARWFMALTLIKMEEKEQSYSILKELSSSHSLYTNKARDLLEALAFESSFW